MMGVDEAQDERELPFKYDDGRVGDSRESERCSDRACDGNR